MTNLICHDLNIVKHLLIVVWDSCKLLNYKTLKLYKMFEIPTMVVHCIRANPHIIQSLHFIDILVHVVQSKWKTFCMDQQLQIIQPDKCSCTNKTFCNLKWQVDNMIFISLK